MNNNDFKGFCETRLKETTNFVLFYIKQLPIVITPMVVGNHSGQKRLWDLICETQSKYDFKEWCL